MSDETSAPAGGDDTLVATAPAETPESLSAEDAGRALAELRWKRNNPEPAPESAVETPEQSPEKADADQPEADPGEEPEAAEPEETPSIEPPRSWTKEAKERWNALPPDTQAYLAEREQQRDREVRRSQNEAAEARKAVEAERASVEQLRKDYEAKLPALVKTMEATLQQEFGDIQNIADVRKLQSEDPFRFQQWQLRQMELAAAQKEQQDSDQRQTQEKQSSWAKFVRSESEAFAEDEPDFKAKEGEYTKKAAQLLGDIGFTEAELGKLAIGEEKISLYDRRMQKLLFRAIRLDEIKAAPAKAVPKTVPPVQRPGTAAPKGARDSERIQALQKTFERDPSVENATALRLARLKRA